MPVAFFHFLLFIFISGSILGANILRRVTFSQRTFSEEIFLCFTATASQQQEPLLQQWCQLKNLKCSPAGWLIEIPSYIFLIARKWTHLSQCPKIRDSVRKTWCKLDVRLECESASILPRRPWFAKKSKGFLNYWLLRCLTLVKKLIHLLYMTKILTIKINQKWSQLTQSNTTFLYLRKFLLPFWLWSSSQILFIPLT